VSDPTPSATSGRNVVALGGGHGLAVVLRAARSYAMSITAVVSVADDGGSSGRLRRALDVAPPGDLRKALVALAAPDSVWADAFEHRFEGGDLGGHALGNLILVGLGDTLGDFTRALDEAARVLGAVGRVRPATTEGVVLKAQVEAEPRDGAAGARASVEGQVAVANAAGRIRRVELIPGDAAAHPDSLAAIAEADQIVLAPGSLYTSLLPVLAVAQIQTAIATAPGAVVQVCNLRTEPPETEGLDAVDHLRAVLEHGARVDTFLWEHGGQLSCDEDIVRSLGVEPVAGSLAGSNGAVHDPRRLASALSDLLQSA
jgi:uncharacterized cofD-like protein